METSMYVRTILEQINNKQTKMHERGFYQSN